MEGAYEDGEVLYQVCCLECGAEGPHGETRKDACKLWDAKHGRHRPADMRVCRRPCRRTGHRPDHRVACGDREGALPQAEVLRPRRRTAQSGGVGGPVRHARRLDPVPVPLPGERPGEPGEAQASRIVEGARAVVLAMSEGGADAVIDAALELLQASEAVLRKYPPEDVSIWYLRVVERSALRGDYDGGK